MLAEEGTTVVVVVVVIESVFPPELQGKTQPMPLPPRPLGMTSALPGIASPFEKNEKKKWKRHPAHTKQNMVSYIIARVTWCNRGVTHEGFSDLMGEGIQ